MDSLQFNYRWLGIAILISIVVHALSILTLGPYKQPYQKEYRDPLRISLKKLAPLFQPEKKLVDEQSLDKSELPTQIESDSNNETSHSSEPIVDNTPDLKKNTTNYGSVVQS